MAPVILDGSTLEGGGQLTRMALALSAITNTPIRIHSIRAGRAPRLRPSRGKDKGRSKSSTQKGVEGGLKESHLAALQWLAAQSEADVSGDEVGSREVTFRPGKSRGRMSTVKKVDNSDIIELQNPGSVGLVFQAVYPYMVFGTPRHLQSNPSNTNHSQPKELYNLTIKGGTNVSKSMSVDYIQHVFLPTITRIGLPSFSIQIHRRGWAGDATTSQIGEITITMPATEQHISRPPIDKTWKQAIQTGAGFVLPSFTIGSPRGSIFLIQAHIIANTDATLDKIYRFLTNKLNHLLTLSNGFTTNAKLVFATAEESHSDRRTYILLTAHSTNYCILGRDVLSTGAKIRGENDENRMLDGMCGRVVTDLMSEIATGNCVDEFMADQLVVFQALAEGKSLVGVGSTQPAGVVDNCRQEVEKTTTDHDCDDDDNDEDINGDEAQLQSLSPHVKKLSISNNTSIKGDNTGTLHAQTVRWVCQQILPNTTTTTTINKANHNAADLIPNLNEENTTTVKNRHETSRKQAQQQLRFESGGVCHGIGWNVT